MFKTYDTDRNQPWHQKLHHSLLYGWLHHFFMALIVLYALSLSFYGTPFHSDFYEKLNLVVDDIFLGFFVLELILKVLVAPKEFSKYPWNLMDLGILVVTFITPHAKILRLLRLFIYIHTFVNNSVINRVVHTFIHSLPTLGVSTFILSSVIFSYGLFSTHMFGGQFPEFFGHVGRSIYTLFQIMTLESWSAGVVRPIMEIYPWAWVVFISFILLSTYGLTNIFVGAIVNAMTFVDNSQSADPTIKDLKTQIEELKTLILKQESNKIKK
ncbi:MAG: ion transporter [Candidatus Paracaedibacteraceae bacterium]|nr:ion transporter [Candidatus Paracaedibacteraceae bacterium]